MSIDALKSLFMKSKPIKQDDDHSNGWESSLHYKNFDHELKNQTMLK